MFFKYTGISSIVLMFYKNEDELYMLGTLGCMLLIFIILKTSLINKHKSNKLQKIKSSLLISFITLFKVF
jgi:hypothetical protein